MGLSVATSLMPGEAVSGNPQHYGEEFQSEANQIKGCQAFRYEGNGSFRGVLYSAPDGGIFDCENPQRISNRFVGKVANVNDVVRFY